MLQFKMGSSSGYLCIWVLILSHFLILLQDKVTISMILDLKLDLIIFTQPYTCRSEAGEVPRHAHLVRGNSIVSGTHFGGE